MRLQSPDGRPETSAARLRRRLELAPEPFVAPYGFALDGLPSGGAFVPAQLIAHSEEHGVYLFGETPPATPQGPSAWRGNRTAPRFTLCDPSASGRNNHIPGWVFAFQLAILGAAIALGAVLPR